MSDYADLTALLACHAGARGYYEGLSADLRAALWRRNGVGSYAELQSTVADERERA